MAQPFSRNADNAGFSSNERREDLRVTSHMGKICWNIYLKQFKSSVAFVHDVDPLPK